MTRKMVVKLEVSSLLSLHCCCDSSASRPYPSMKPIATSVQCDSSVSDYMVLSGASGSGEKESAKGPQT
jgi:hypothetical protein